MRVRSSKLREEFDRTRVFVNVKTFTFSGERYVEGSEFDKDKASTRRLRQLYESRFLRMLSAAEVEALAPVAGKPRMPNFPLMAPDVLKQWLQDNGRKPNPRATHPRLVGRAIRRWQELQKAPEVVADAVSN